MNRTLMKTRSVYITFSCGFKQNDFKFSTSQEGIDLKQETVSTEQDVSIQNEIEKKRDVCRLPDRTRQALLTKEMFPLDRKEYFVVKNLRKYYAAYGKKSGINPGLMWPSKEYLKELKKFEAEFQPSLNEMVTRVQERKQNELKAKREREEFIEKNMAKLNDYMKDFQAKMSRKQAEAELQRKRKEKLVEEVQEYLGYQIDPNDERFKHALELKEEEERKALKKAKKQAREQKMMSLLLEAASTKDPTK